ncbi:MAG: BREX system P-loop protein BrxC, partial [Chloroflexi bacterium]|nr:BREX system P-loop protein BrxC [Chloroflexota bacterium]
MNLHDIFAKAVDRPIEGVIKADDLAGLKLEVEEYVFTNEISKRLGAFLEAYTDYQGANGVWISGFFGSGKSHLLKMLALLLENYALDGKPVLEFFLPKCGDDAMLQGDMRRAVAIPSKSILFNIDQKADTISKTEIDAVLSVFVKVFNEMQGYYGKQGYVAQFERDLDDRRLLDSFKQAYGEIAGQAWEQGREQIILEKQNISEAYARISGSSQEAALGIIDKYRADYKLSIEDFAELVNAYIKKQEPGFRL